MPSKALAVKIAMAVGRPNNIIKITAQPLFFYTEFLLLAFGDTNHVVLVLYDHDQAKQSGGQRAKPEQGQPKQCYGLSLLDRR